MRSMRLRITGRVQGVGYRAWTVQTARELGLRGWVRNRTDGSVEAVATGPAQAIAALIEACKRGPRMARVAGVEISDTEDAASEGFSPRATV